MVNMKRFVYIVLGVILTYSCVKYDDAWIKKEFLDQNSRLDKIETMCQRINDNITAVETILSALQEKDIIKSFSIINEDGVTVGYELVFDKKGVVKVYYGKTGDVGQDGKDARKPIVSVKKHTDGKWYWTIDGKWCLDGDGNKVPAISNDEVTPSFKIEDGYWFVSYDGEKTWEQVGVADGSHGDLMLSEVSYDDGSFYLTMADGSVIEIPRMCVLGIELGSVPSNVQPGATFSVEYKVKGGTGNAEVACVGEHGWSAKVVKMEANAGKIEITAPDTLVSGKIVVFASDGDYMTVKAIVFAGEDNGDYFMVSRYDYYEVDATGGYIDVNITTNQDYTVNIPEEAQMWISYVETRVVRTENVRLGIAPNAPGQAAREAEITFEGECDTLSVLICQKAAPYIDSEVDLGPIDGFDNPEDGIVILQQATIGTGVDIVIMGDGFVEKHFVPGGRYEALMKQAYADFFSVEPYASLKEYFNVYYINVLSEDEHDAKPYYDAYGNQNGATQGTANTKLGTTFQQGSTSIDGDDEEVLRYATQAIQMKGALNGGECSYSEAYNRAHKSLVIVLPNVNCYAGTCLMTWLASNTVDYADSYSIAYSSLGNDQTGRQLKYTLIHEAGGHGFAKLSDEYTVSTLTRFSTSEWTKLRNFHGYGVYRNVNEYWTEEESALWSSLDWEFTNETNVYWSELLDESYGYTVSEGLGMYKGAKTYTNMFCRPTVNSMMNSQLAANGQFFNAISRWAIWYRVMKLAGCTTASGFKASLDEFIAFDETLTIETNMAEGATMPNYVMTNEFAPLGPPVLQECEWVGGELVKVND